MEPYHSLNPFYIAHAILRFLVYLTFFIKVKAGIRYGIIWLPALWTFAVDALYVLSFYTRETCCDDPIDVPEGLFIKNDVIFIKWIPVICFWQLFDHSITVAQVFKAVYSYSKPLFPALVILAVTTFRNDNVPMSLFEDNTLAVSMCLPLSIFFLIMAWKSSAFGKQASFLMLGCIFTQLPLSSTVKALVSYLGEYPLFLTPTSQKIQYLILFGVSQFETMGAAILITDAYNRKIQFPNLKEMRRPSDVENVSRENSAMKDVGQLVNIDKAIRT